MWDRKVLEKLEDVVGQFSVSCKFRNIEDNFEWDFSSVYSPIVDREKRLMLEEFAGLYSWWNLSWCVGSDFNIVRFSSEHLGAKSFARLCTISQISYLLMG